jgi:hypothetical protein
VSFLEAFTDASPAGSRACRARIDPAILILE